MFEYPQRMVLAVRCDGLSEADTLLKDAMNRARELMNVLMASDLENVRGNVEECKLYMQGPLGGSDAISISYCIDGDSTEQPGEGSFWSNLRNSLVWLRGIWKQFYEESELLALPQFWDGKLPDDITIKRAMQNALSTVKRRRYASGID